MSAGEALRLEALVGVLPGPSQEGDGGSERSASRSSRGSEAGSVVGPGSGHTTLALAAPDVPHPEAESEAELVPAEGEEEMDSEAEASTGEVDLEAFGRRLMERMDQRVDSAIAQVPRESNSAIGKLTKTAQGQLQQSRKHISELSSAVSDGQAHKERVRLQMVATGHTQDRRHTKTAKAQTEMSAQLASLSAMVERMLITRQEDGPAPMEEDAEAQSSSTPRAPRPQAGESEQVDQTILRANAQTAVGRAQVHKVMHQFLVRHTDSE